MTTETIITAQRNPRWSILTDNDDSFTGCFGILRLRSSSSSLRSQNGRSTPPPPPRSVPVYTPSGSTTPDLKGYTIAPKSAEILGLTPKNAPMTPGSRTSSPVPWRSLSGNDVSSLRSEVKAASLHSEKSSSSLSMRRWPVPLAHSENIITAADPLDVVRRRLREESATSASRSSSAPPPTRNYSRKWRKSQRPAEKPVSNNPRESTESTDRTSTEIESEVQELEPAHIVEDEIPDTNKFDALLAPTIASSDPSSRRSSARIRSAAYTTFAWMEMQTDAKSSRGSWLLVDEKVTSPTGHTANDRKKRSPHSSLGSASESSVKRDDKRDTLEWMGVKPADFPVPLVGPVA